MRLGKGEGGAGWGGAIKSPGGASKAVPLLNRMIIFIVLFLDDDKRPSMIMCIEIHVLLSMCVAHVCVCVRLLSWGRVSVYKGTNECRIKYKLTKI